MEKETKSTEAVIIGGGQAGLATGYFLKRSGMQFIILDENTRIGDSWRKRWDSLKLFTPSKHDNLPGMPFHGPGDSFPGKEEVADYLEHYAQEFSLPVQLNAKVHKLYQRNNHFEIETGAMNFITGNVIVATGTNPFPYVPAISAGLDPNIFQIHSSVYKGPKSVPDGDVLVVGAATSGIEIAIELSETHKTYISGNPTFHIPDRILKYGGEAYWWFISNIVTVATPIGRKAKKQIIHGGSPLIRVSAKHLDIAGVKRLPRMTSVKNGLPGFGDGSSVKISSVIWATGYRPDFSWIGMHVTDKTGWPVTFRGISQVVKGLYFVGIPFQYGLTSGLIGGVGRDAEYITRHLLINHSGA
jgi:putative flavoprotein involved in K+ transport